jgi:hypothetical protein
VVCNSNKTEQKGGSAGWRSGRTSDKNVKNVKTSFFETMSEAQKDLEDVSAGIGFF